MTITRVHVCLSVCSLDEISPRKVNGGMTLNFLNRQLEFIYTLLKSAGLSNQRPNTKEGKFLRIDIKIAGERFFGQFLRNSSLGIIITGLSEN